MNRGGEPAKIALGLLKLTVSCVADSVCDGSADNAVGAELSVQMRDLVPQLAVLMIEFMDALVRQGEALS